MSKLMWKPGTMLYPLPAVMVSCRNNEGINNILTVAWTGIICTNPAMLYISVRPERHSYNMIKETGEFVINIPNRKLAFATDFCGVKSGRDIDKFAHLKLTPAKSNLVAAPFIDECPVNLECKVKEIVKLGSHDMFIAEILCVNVDEGLLDSKGKLQLNKADLICYTHGEYRTLADSMGSFGFSVRKKDDKKRK
ncbi:MAG: flavin reductase protein [Clostridia bacterium]|jgi:flavin reductase (DIM6/NTAB) family NADH-FMN oxidoreductase RutF|nr:flavin reductase protein [Clostridia bacterium]